MIEMELTDITKETALESNAQEPQLTLNLNSRKHKAIYEALTTNQMINMKLSDGTKIDMILVQEIYPNEEGEYGVEYSDAIGGGVRKFVKFSDIESSETLF